MREDAQREAAAQLGLQPHQAEEHQHQPQQHAGDAAHGAFASYALQGNAGSSSKPCTPAAGPSPLPPLRDPRARLPFRHDKAAKDHAHTRSGGTKEAGGLPERDSGGE